MADKHVESSVSFVSREMQTRTMMRYHYAAIRGLKSREVIVPSDGEDVEELELSSVVNETVK